MNWVWTIRSRDGGMNGLEFAQCLTAGSWTRVLVHAAPAQAAVEVRTADGDLLARGEADRQGDYSPMSLLELDGETFRRSEVWPDDGLVGLPVLLAGGEVGLLQRWEHAPDHSWWRWSVEFANHTGQPPDWSPPG